MLTKIVMDGPATFKKRSVIETDKKVNLIYGLNATGKSTICKFLRDPTADMYRSCLLQKGNDVELLVFNEDFIEENFYVSDTIKGIFSLSKENKEAEVKIAALLKKIAASVEEKDQLQTAHQRDMSRLQKELDGVTDKIFDVKRKYAGGDRVLEYCLEGVMAKKEKLVEKLLKVAKPAQQPSDTAAALQDEARLLKKSEGGAPEPTLPKYVLGLKDYEQNPVFAKAIVGAQNSNFSDFINKLRMSDWIKKGIDFVDIESDRPVACPFCQERTIDDRVISELNAYFDKTFEDQIANLLVIQSEYDRCANDFKEIYPMTGGLFFDENIRLLEDKLRTELEANLLLIREKVASPSTSVELMSTKDTLKELGDLIDKVNQDIVNHNEKMANVGRVMKDIDRRFWSLMRWSYDQSISFYQSLQEQIRDLTSAQDVKLRVLNERLSAHSIELAEAQKGTVNIDEAVTRINAELINMGITDFKIKRYSDTLYQLERPNGGAGSFKTLSEGEKMIIALLYFCELCAGKESPDDVVQNKVAVFDDPISSLSHIYVFNVGRLLHHKFFRGNLASQVFVFTHSLYFFYELTDTNHERRSGSQALFRVTKNGDGSSVVAMSYEEIQNDYQSYWQIINDERQHPALIANCMRNVVEYFFGFVEKRDFNSVFQKPELQKNKFQAFNRYMNRESHSMGQNIFDIKEFDYQVFRDGLGLIFESAGYPEHYRQMAKIA